MTATDDRFEAVKVQLGDIKIEVLNEASFQADGKNSHDVGPETLGSRGNRAGAT